MRRAALLLACLLPLAPAQASEIEYFHTPSGNIHCMAWDDPSPYIRCDVMQHGYTPPVRPLDECPYEEGDWGSTFFLENAGPGQMICASDSVYNADGRVLQYGQTFTYADMTCTSQTDGLLCENGGGGGMLISRKRQKLY